ncbi:hypothetical protein Agub_g1139 [Astrephomene gubernaculifera]|uniref:EF-hand domain-containing protein n=1 Tax=Astrephomene gubernaculifera TaxID=47775 RepID=A0AAD3HH87_9CHLO|nr:hypothetical protein Agub_g1139 [Astrephomene gubernaculifera]
MMLSSGHFHIGDTQLLRGRCRYATYARWNSWGIGNTKAPSSLASGVRRQPCKCECLNAETQAMYAPDVHNPACPKPTPDAAAARRGLASMAQLASAWAQVSSRLAPGTSLDSTDPMEGPTAPAAVATAGGTYPQPRDTAGRDGGGGASGWGAADGVAVGRPVEALLQPVTVSDASPSLLPEHIASGSAAHALLQQPQQQAQQQHHQTGALSALLQPPIHHYHHHQQQEQQHQHHQQQEQQQQHAHISANTRQPWMHPPTPLQHQHHQPPPLQPNPHPQQNQQQQQQHFEAIITALKLALASLQSAPPRRDGRTPATRAVQLASTLADLCAAGLPLDAAAMCAGVVAEAAELGALGHDVIRAQLGPGVAALVHDMLRVREAPQRIEVLDDEGASAVREWCLACHDVRACAVEVVGWWDELQHLGGLPRGEQQALAMESLQIGAPLGHALGLGPLSAMMEDICLRVLFPSSYASTSAWLRALLGPGEAGLAAARQQLHATLEAHPQFGALSGGLLIKSRTKSLFSVMKKLLHLGDMARGGRSREELYDLLGMRVIVQPPPHLPPGEAEAAATKACYIVQEVACNLWRPIPTRSKDYVTTPKVNGYQSIHLTLQLDSQSTNATYPYGTGKASEAAAADVAGDGPMGPSGPLFMELQIRTDAMDRAAESGDAAHAVYKGGMDAHTARQLQAWTLELRSRLASSPRGQLLLRAASKGGALRSQASLSPEEAQAAAERRRRRRERRAAAAAAAATAVAEAAAAEPSPDAVAGAAVATAAVEEPTPPAASAVVHSLDPKGAAGVVVVGAAMEPPVPTLLPRPRRPGGSVAHTPGLPPSPPLATKPPHLHPPRVEPRRDGAMPVTAATAARHEDGPSDAHEREDQRRLDRGTPAKERQCGGKGAVLPVASIEAAANGSSRTATTAATSNGNVGASAPPLAVPSPHVFAAMPTSSPAASAALPMPSSSPPSLLLSSSTAHGQPGSSLNGQQPEQQGQLPDQLLEGSHQLPDQRQQWLGGEQQQQLEEGGGPQQAGAMLFGSLGSIDEFDEAVVIGFPPRDAAAAAEELFRHLDVNGDGRLSLGEVQQALLDLAAPASDRDAAALMAALDLNGDGGVSLEEFVEGVRSAQLQQQQE